MYFFKSMNIFKIYEPKKCIAEWRGDCYTKLHQVEQQFPQVSAGENKKKKENSIRQILELQRQTNYDIEI